MKDEKGFVFNDNKGFKKELTPAEEEYAKRTMESWGIPILETQQEMKSETPNEEELRERFENCQRWYKDFTEYIKSALPKDRKYVLDLPKYQIAKESMKYISSLLYLKCKDSLFDENVKFEIEWDTGFAGEIYDSISLSAVFFDVEFSKSELLSLCNAIPDDAYITFTQWGDIEEGKMCMNVSYKNCRRLVSASGYKEQNQDDYDEELDSILRNLDPSDLDLDLDDIDLDLDDIDLDLDDIDLDPDDIDLDFDEDDELDW